MLPAFISHMPPPPCPCILFPSIGNRVALPCFASCFGKSSLTLILSPQGQFSTVRQSCTAAGAIAITTHGGTKSPTRLCARLPSRLPCASRLASYTRCATGPGRRPWRAIPNQSRGVDMLQMAWIVRQDSKARQVHEAPATPGTAQVIVNPG